MSGGSETKQPSRWVSRPVAHDACERTCLIPTCPLRGSCPPARVACALSMKKRPLTFHTERLTARAGFPLFPSAEVTVTRMDPTDSWALSASEEEDSKKKERNFTIGSTGLRVWPWKESDHSLCREDEYEYVDHNPVYKEVTCSQKIQDGVNVDGKGFRSMCRRLWRRDKDSESCKNGGTLLS